ncbi:SRPBCC family protein [Microbacterium sp. ASV49]|uniref:SRPBCC family protein n=1 Tax=Microbacterium candidum TaxID=3041922 RepID=A0ABT7MTK7_9MICO|nr:SRPBCC family protein [Microbacterium sp. ASV49]MDL9977780.1 SRPBCC family protein [Microbacterium sp. ASV49]
MDARYHFVSTYRVVGDPMRVWEVLRDVEGWVQWWRGLERVELLRAPAGAADVGAAHRYTVRAPFGYRFTYETEITAIEPMRFVEAVASGELVGRGRAAVEPFQDDRLTIWFAWLVETPKPWMRALSPLARPVFTWNHHRMMDAFGAGFAGAADVRLVSAEHVALAPGDPGFWVLPEPGR